MNKVKRYISGREPHYAKKQCVNSDESDIDSDTNEHRRRKQLVSSYSSTSTSGKRSQRKRNSSSTSESSETDNDEESERRNAFSRKKHIIEDDTANGQVRDLSDSDLSESEIEKRRENIRKRLLQKNAKRKHSVSSADDDDGEDEEDEEKNEKDRRQKVKLSGDSSSDESDEESSDSDEDDDDDDDDEDDDETGMPRLKPVFVAKKHRVTIMKKKTEEMEEKERETERLIAAEEQRKQTLRLVEDLIRKEQKSEKSFRDKVEGASSAAGMIEAVAIEAKLEDVCTDDDEGDGDEAAYEQWKLRELTRLKRDKDEKEQQAREEAELERLRTMTEDERREVLRANPKVVTNRPEVKGKYKFLQKYYHRGAFYLDKEDEVLKRDFTTATLDDHFDKTTLPKVMQVKNFGKSGRTKYTHLLDQDTTRFDNPWCSESAQTLKFSATQAAGLKQSFTKPSHRNRHH